jgi:nicotinate-nucleotide adenylyltransferase
MPTAPEAPITPPAIPRSRGMRTLLVFGGTFDPIHYGHFMVPLAAMTLDFKSSGRLLFVPAARSPHKSTGPVAADEHRIGMLRAFTAASDLCAFWTDEIDRAVPGEPSYMIDTLTRLRSVIRPTVKFRLVIGSDQAAAFHRWHRPRDIIALAEPYVLFREPFASDQAFLDSIDRSFWTNADLKRWRGWIANAPVIREDNSTAVRAAIPGAPKDILQWRAMDGLQYVPEAVARYIVANNLYGFRLPTKNPA